MNEREKLNMMILRAKIRTEEKLNRYAEKWVAEEAVVAGQPKPYQGERDTPRIMEEQNAS